MEHAVISDAITGKERSALCGEAFNALAQFYRAFNSRDLELMQANWHMGDDIAMDNPIGQIGRKWGEIGPVYEKLFGGPARVYVEFHDYSLHETPDMFYAVGASEAISHARGKP